MILTCPQCATRYEADAAKFPAAGRTVRCAKCGHSWHQPAPAGTSEPAPAPLEDFLPPDEAPVPAAATTAAPAAAPSVLSSPAPLATDSPGRPRVRTVVAKGSASSWPARIALAAGWLGLVAIVLLIAFSAVRYRRDIAVAWPQSASLYSALGFNVNRQGMVFRDVAYAREIEDGQGVLVVTGDIRNNADRALPVPHTIRITLSDAANRELYHWTFAAGAATLKPGQSVAFRTRLERPPAETRHLEVRFDAS